MSSDIEGVSQHDLHALVDGELHPEDRPGVLAELERGPEQAVELYRLQTLKEQVRLAYRRVPEPPRGQRPAGGGLRSLAAGLLLLAGGIFLGWISYPGTDGARLVLVNTSGLGSAPAAAENAELRVVFHQTNGDMMAAGELLDEVESMLALYRGRNLALRVEIVANGEGLGLLRVGLSRYRERISSLAREFPNLAFVACQNTIDRLRVEEGVEVVLLPGVELTRSGVTRVVRRQREGWAYIQS